MECVAKREQADTQGIRGIQDRRRPHEFRQRIPYLWVRIPKGGLCWFADTDRGWVRSDGLETPALEVRRMEEDGVAELKSNVIAEPVTLETARTIVFGMIPTPVRPLPPDWRKRGWRSPIITGFGKEWESGRFS